MMADIYRDDWASRFREIERRLGALEKMPLTFDLPFLMTAVQDYEAGGRSIAIPYDTWTLCFWGYFPLAIYPGVSLQAHVLTPAGTTAAVRLENYVVGGSISDEVVIAANTDFMHDFRWLHSQPLGTRPFVPSLWCRRTSGAGTVHCFLPVTPMLMTQQSVNALGGYTTAG